MSRLGGRISKSPTPVGSGEKVGEQERLSGELDLGKPKPTKPWSPFYQVLVGSALDLWVAGTYLRVLI
jgi:hypothetical protein